METEAEEVKVGPEEEGGGEGRAEDIADGVRQGE